MKKRSKLVLIATVLLWLTSGWMSPGIWAGENQDKDAVAYRAAYRLYMEENWVEAARVMDAFVRDFPRSPYVDDARYFRCSVREKMDESQEEVFACYQSYIKTHPDSSYVDNAKSNMIRIGNLLVKQGKTQYKALIQSFYEESEEDIKLAALHALEDMGDEAALDVIFELYDESSSSRMRSRIIHILEDFESPQALEKLKEIARQESDPDLRRRAVFAVAEWDDEAPIEFLLEIADHLTHG